MTYAGRSSRSPAKSGWVTGPSSRASPSSDGAQQRPGVVDHLLPPLGRQVQIQRQVRRPGPQHGEQRDDHVDAARQGQRDDLLRAGAPGDQPARDGVDPRVQLGVGEPLVAATRATAAGVRRACAASISAMVIVGNSRLPCPAGCAAPSGTAPAASSPSASVAAR